jgi:hypothetical protein
MHRLLAMYAQEPNSPKPQPTALIHCVIAAQLATLVNPGAALARARRRRVEDARLHLTGQRRVHGQDVQVRHGGAQALHALVEDLTRCVDFLLTREEDQHVALGLRQVDLRPRRHAERVSG